MFAATLSIFVVWNVLGTVDLPVHQSLALSLLEPVNVVSARFTDDEPEKGAEEEPLYPPLAPLEEDKVKRLLDSFRNRNSEKRKKYEQQMIEMGRGAVPALLKKAVTRHEAQGECVYNCLVALMNDRDLPLLLEKHARSKNLRLRKLAILKIAASGEEQHLDLLKESLKDEDPAIRLEAALGLTTLGHTGGLKEVAAAVAAAGSQPPPRLFEPLPALKGKVFTGHFFPLLVHDEDPTVRAAAAQMIGAINDQKLNHILEKGLEDSHNLVQAATVNAFRKVMDNEEPRNYDNVFELVEAVDRWKKRLGDSR